VNIIAFYLRGTLILLLFNHIASSYFSYGKLPQLYYSTVWPEIKLLPDIPSAVVFFMLVKQASVFLLIVGNVRL
jgi:hypothetical protein